MSRNTRRQWIERNRRQPTRHPGSKSNRYERHRSWGSTVQRRNLKRWIQTRYKVAYLRGKESGEDA